MLVKNFTPGARYDVAYEKNVHESRKPRLAVWHPYLSLSKQGGCPIRALGDHQPVGMTRTPRENRTPSNKT